ncbi:hypothetical protein MPTK1_2g05210 [Marchantia polymorpha subsp. ruderalis]|uniref:Uncharacterized protein n=1 Tax=Marchantia polymorpha TaxID=3197 RepID=A0A2R6X7Z2_MARPO|nr:hypothetical protein MARPO_0031s0175 [Marchantia polymorpha]BBN01162.1 hypothetical protein Mp_2g05210 [Marchantia polymorpha subsp. ruderalis]|eukprot:PTQ42213.1 hypothetical protein MARPO_0031s0175 [Marchantia polymorpha]
MEDTDPLRGVMSEIEHLEGVCNEFLRKFGTGRSERRPESVEVGIQEPDTGIESTNIEESEEFEPLQSCSPGDSSGLGPSKAEPAPEHTDSVGAAFNCSRIGPGLSASSGIESIPSRVSAQTRTSAQDQTTRIQESRALNLGQAAGPALSPPLSDRRDGDSPNSTISSISRTEKQKTVDRNLDESVGRNSADMVGRDTQSVSDISKRLRVSKAACSIASQTIRTSSR